MAWWLLAAGMPVAAADPAAVVDPGDDALFTHVAQKAQQFVVRIETVGGAQPLEQLLAAEPPKQGDDPSDEDQPGDGDRPAEKSDPAPKRDPENPNLFRDSPGSSFLLADGPTTGIIYSADGYILTSSFNFVRAPSVVTVKLFDGRQLTARIVGRDQVRKLALLKIDAENLPTPQWTPREEIRVGQWAIALGHGFGGASTSVSVGIVSGLNRMMGNAIQADTKLSPANYGGPLLDSAGRVLGIAVPMAQRHGELAGIQLYDSGVGFAIPGWRVHEIADQLKQGKSFYRGWLGMQLDPRDPDGMRILRSADPSPMRTAGAHDGDTIVAINDQPIKHFGQLTKALYMIPAGEPVNVRLLRGADYIDVEVILARSDELGELPPIAEPFDPSTPDNQDIPDNQNSPEDK